MMSREVVEAAAAYSPSGWFGKLLACVGVVAMVVGH